MEHPTDHQFLAIESGAHSGAHGQNPLTPATDAQAVAGNYKMGRVRIHGLDISIENPRGAHRSGINPDGTRWSSQMAGHYGYIRRSRGADGDHVDCFIGAFPQSDKAFVINQYVDGRFDEHKVILCAFDADDARSIYQRSYFRGWPGLHSLVPCSIPQLKFWLKQGDTARPLSPDHLPHEATMTAPNRIIWTPAAEPVDMSVDKLLYDMRRAEPHNDLLMDSVSLRDVIEDADEMLALDALTAPFAKIERKMAMLRAVMDRSSPAIKTVGDPQISDPFKAQGVAQVAALFELSDGQTITIFFHNPDTTPKKLMPADELISWKWLLNKKDITIVVAPEKGADLNVRDVARRVMKLAEKNSPAFQRANARRAEKMQVIDGLKAEVAQLSNELDAKVARRDALALAVEEKAARPVPAQPDDEVVDIGAVAKAQKAAVLIALESLGWTREGNFATKSFEGMRSGQGFHGGTTGTLMVTARATDFAISWGVNVLGWVGRFEGKDPFIIAAEIDQTAGQIAAAKRAEVQSMTAQPQASGPGEFVAPTRPFADYVNDAGGDDYEAAKSFYRNELQGKTVIRPGFGPIELTGKGLKKSSTGMRNDPLKAKLIPHVPDILRTGEYVGKEDAYKARPDGTVAFHFFMKDVDVGALSITVGVSAGEDQSRRYFYNVNHSESEGWKRKKAQGLPGAVVQDLEPSQGGILDATLSSVGQAAEDINIVILCVINNATGERMRDMEDDLGGGTPEQPSTINPAPLPYAFASITPDAEALMRMNKAAFGAAEQIDRALTAKGFKLEWSATSDVVMDGVSGPGILFDDVGPDSFLLDGPRALKAEISGDGEPRGAVIIRGDGLTQWELADGTRPPLTNEDGDNVWPGYDDDTDESISEMYGPDAVSGWLGVDDGVRAWLENTNEVELPADPDMPESTPEREALIDRIVAAAKTKTMSRLNPVTRVIDGKTYVVQKEPNGTTVGRRYATTGDFYAAVDLDWRSTEGELRVNLAEQNDDELNATAEYWLKTAASAPTSTEPPASAVGSPVLAPAPASAEAPAPAVGTDVPVAGGAPTVESSGADPGLPYVSAAELASHYKASNLNAEQAWSAFVKDTAVIQIVRSDDVTANGFGELYRDVRRAEKSTEYPGVVPVSPNGWETPPELVVAKWLYDRGLAADRVAVYESVMDYLKRFPGTSLTLDQIMEKIEGEKIIQANMERSRLKAKAESDKLSTFQPFDPATLKMPTAPQLRGTGWRDFETPDGTPGWSNGNVIDIQKMPASIAADMEKNPPQVSAAKGRVERVLANAKSQAKDLLHVIAEKNHRASAKDKGTRFLVLTNEAGTYPVLVNRFFYAYFYKAYPGAEFWSSDLRNALVTVKHRGQVVGVLAPAVQSDGDLVRAMNAAAPKPAAAGVPGEKTASPSVPDESHETHLTYGDGEWSILHQGTAMSAKSTYARTMDVARKLGLTKGLAHGRVWNGDVLAWQDVSEVSAADQNKTLLEDVAAGNHPDMLSPDLADRLEAAYTPHAGDAEWDALFERAVDAYMDAGLKATEGM